MSARLSGSMPMNAAFGCSFVASASSVPVPQPRSWIATGHRGRTTNEHTGEAELTATMIVLTDMTAPIAGCSTNPHGARTPAAMTKMV